MVDPSSEASHLVRPLIPTRKQVRSQHRDYVIAVQAPAYALSPTAFATESAFAEHLKELRRSIGPRFRRLVLIAPSLTEAQYLAKKEHLGVVSLDGDGIVLVAAHSTSTSARHFWLRHARRIWRDVRLAVQQADMVHSGLADDIYRPLLGFVNLAAWLSKRPIIFVVDIDFREHTRRYYQLGTWGLKSYLVNRFVYDPIKWVQVWFAARNFQLVLLKSASMVRDFGGGRSSVKNFHDTVHAAEDVLTDEALSARMHKLRDPSLPLEVVFFGRFVPYKGLSRAVEAIGIARQQGIDVRLTLIGEGECLLALKEQVSQAKLESAVAFLPSVPYGRALFEQLDKAHVSIATPLVEDTPRAAFDSMSRGLPVLAFDISYFRDLGAETGAVVLAEWPHAQALATQLAALSRDRERIAEMARRGVLFARDNTQSKWLKRRADWVAELWNA
jgi:glycosyltransferase involved in cell wall biosynthesis